MAKHHSDYQQRIIRNYYQNQDAIMVQRLSGLVSDLYLATGKSRTRLWTRVQAALQKLKIPDSQIQHIVESDNPALLAGLVQQLLEKQ